MDLKIIFEGQITRQVMIVCGIIGFIAIGAELNEARSAETSSEEVSDSLASPQSTIFSEEYVASWFDHYILDFGLGSAQSVIRVRDQESNEQQAKMTSLSVPFPSFGLTSPMSYLFGSNFGYSLQFGYTWSSISNQEVNGAVEDIGTSATAYSVYLMPVLGYHFGDRDSVEQGHRSLLLGLGVGGGYLSASGNFTTTDADTQETETFDFNRLTYATKLVAIGRWNRWSLQIQVGGPTANSGGRKFEIFDTQVSLGYAYEMKEFFSSGRVRTTSVTSEIGAVVKDGKPSGAVPNSSVAPRIVDGKTSNLTLFVGSRNLPILGKKEFNSEKEKSSTAGGGLHLDYRKRHWPLSIIFDIAAYSASPVSTTTDLFSEGNAQNVTLEAKLAEATLGLRKKWRQWESADLYLDGAFRFAYAMFEGSAGNTKLKDEGFSFGFAFGGGATYHFAYNWNAGLQVSLISGQTDYLDIVDEQTYGAFRLHIGRSF